MSKARHVSETAATQWLRTHQVAFSGHPYDYVEHGGAAHAASALGLPLHQIAKTLIMQDDQAKPLVVLMHGDCEVSLKNLARQIGTRHVEPCKPADAQRHSGYLVGGTSPFGTRKKMPVWVEDGLLQMARIYLNGGRRGFLIELDPSVLTSLLGAQAVRVALP